MIVEIADVRLHLADSPFGLADAGRGGLLVLLAGAVRRHVILRLGGQRRGLHGLVVGRGLVELLRRNHSVVVEVLHALVGLAGQFQPGLRLLPHVHRGLDLLHAGAGQRHGVQRGGGALHGLGLPELGLQFGRRERVEELSLLHAVALGHFHVVDAARNLRRGFVGGALHRALNQRRGPFGEVPADQYDREDDDRCGRQNSDYVASFHIVCLLSISYCLRGPATGRNVKPALSRSNFRFLSRRREPPARRCGARRTDIRR